MSRLARKAGFFGVRCWGFAVVGTIAMQIYLTDPSRIWSSYWKKERAPSAGSGHIAVFGFRM